MKLNHRLKQILTGKIFSFTAPISATIVGLALVFLSLSAQAQDPEYSQFYANPLTLNPALTGTNALPRLVSNYRNQWPREGSTFVTYNLSYDQYVPSLHGGLGVRMMYDRELNGVINSTAASLIYSEHIKASDRFFFTLALEGGVLYKQYNVSGLIFPGMIDQENGNILATYPLPFENGKKIIPDFSFGMAGEVDEFYFGAAFHHLTEPDQSLMDGDHLGRIPLKVTLHAGTKAHLLHQSLFSREFTLSPNIIYQQQGSFKQLNAGMYMRENALTLGMWYRDNGGIRPNAIIGMIGLQKEFFQIGYSYDFNLSNLSSYSMGSHEISLIFFFGEFHSRFFHDTMLIPQM